MDKTGKNVLTYFSRVVLFHITGFYQWFVNSKDLSLQMTDKNVSQIRTLKTAYWIEMIDYSIEYQDIRGHIAERLYGKQYNKFCKQPRPKDATLCIWGWESNPRESKRSLRSWSFSVPFAPQMPWNPQKCPYESKLSTAIFLISAAFKSIWSS